MKQEAVSENSKEFNITKAFSEFVSCLYIDKVWHTWVSVGRNVKRKIGKLAIQLCANNQPIPQS